MADLYTVSLLDLMPESLKQDPVVVAMAKALDVEWAGLAQETRKAILYENLELFSNDVLDMIAIDNHVDFYDTTLPLEKKCELIRNSDAVHRHKGTPYAVEQVVSAAFDDASVLEWFDYEGSPYMFKVTTTDRVISEKTYTDLIRAINSVKNRRSHLEMISIRRDNNTQLYAGGAVSTLKICTIKPAT